MKRVLLFFGIANLVSINNFNYIPVRWVFCAEGAELMMHPFYGASQAHYTLHSTKYKDTLHVAIQFKMNVLSNEVILKYWLLI
jgi:hypothetical protein